MSLGTRFRMRPEAKVTLKTGVGGALVGLMLMGGSLGAAVAQDATPAASPAAEAVASWIPEFPTDVTIDDDSSTVGVQIGEIVEMNSSTFETRPYVILQLVNNTESDLQVAVFQMPAEFELPEVWEPTAFAFPMTEDALPDGVAAIGSTMADPGTTTEAVLVNPAPATYVVVTNTGISAAFTVVERAVVDVPDVLATPAG